MRLSASATVVGLVASLLVTVPAAAAPMCFGRRATILGRDDPRRPDDIRGTPGADVIVARDGDDTIDGRGGNDRICGGDGFDLIDGRGGRDRIEGGRGGDTLNGDAEADILDGGPGHLDALFGDDGDDVLRGGGGDFDGLVGGRGTDRMDGGSGNDVAYFFDSLRGVQVDLRTDSAAGWGKDVIASVEGVIGSNLDDTIVGDDDSNLLVGQGGNDTIQALGSGSIPSGTSDLLSGGPGVNLLDGGEGGDLVDYDDSPAGVTLDLASGSASGWGDDELVGIEGAVGSALDDSLTGDDGPNAFVGGDGDDSLDGAGGIDEVAYFDSFEPVIVDLAQGMATGWGADSLAGFENVTGSAHADTLTGDDGGNGIVGGSGNDSLFGLSGDDVLFGALGADDADGGEGTDVCEAETETACESDPLIAAMPIVRLWDVAYRVGGPVRR